MHNLHKKGIEVLENLISFKTINHPDENIYPDSSILKYLEILLKSWNKDYKVKYFEEGHYKSIYIFPHLDKSCFILFLGHLDVVPVSNEWQYEPFELTLRDSEIGYGRGSKDCKGSVVSALLTLYQINTDPEFKRLKNEVGIYLSTDEETGGRFGANVFFKDAKKNNSLPQYVINVDGGPRVVYKRRAGFKVQLSCLPLNGELKGSLEEKIFRTRVLHDNNRHSAYFVPGVDTHPLLSLSKYLKLNPHLKLKKISGEWIKGNVIPNSVTAEFINTITISNLLESHDYDKNMHDLILLLRKITLFNLDTKIVSDFGITINPNIVKYTQEDGITIDLDIRIFLNSESRSLLVEAINKQIPSTFESLDVICSGSSGYFYTNPQNELVTTANEVLKQFKLIEKNEVPIEQEGASDARYVTLHNIPVIDLGPQGGNIHGDDEFINLKSMIIYSKVYTEIIKKLLD